MSSITANQLESIKSANHAASVAWEAARFVEGDVVLSHGHTAKRSAACIWTDTLTGTEYTTLSRWIRHKLNRKSFDVKWGTYLMVGSFPLQMCRVPAPAERANYGPWAAGCPWYLPSQSVVVATANTIPAVPETANNLVQQDTGNKNAISMLESKLDSIKNRLVQFNERIAASEERISLLAEKERILTEQQNGLAALLNMVSEREQRLNTAIATSESHERRINNLEERLLAVGAVAAHTVLFKQRIEALEARAETL